MVPTQPGSAATGAREPRRHPLRGPGPPRGASSSWGPLLCCMRPSVRLSRENHAVTELTESVQLAAPAPHELGQSSFLMRDQPQGCRGGAKLGKAVTCGPWRGHGHSQWLVTPRSPCGPHRELPTWAVLYARRPGTP